MTWFRVDDGFPQHPKVLAIPRRDRVAAVGLWTLAGGWCSAQLTDGCLAAHMVDELGSSRKYADLLVRVGLWESVDGGYRFHDWADWNPTRAQVEAERQATRDRVAKFRERKRNAVSNGVTPATVTALHGSGNGVTPPEVTRYNGVSNGPPVPTRPDPSLQPLPPTPLAGEGEAEQEELPAADEKPASSRAKQRRRIPPDWQPSPGVRANVDERFPGWEQRETVEEFRDYWLAAGRPMADWDLTWRNRVREVAAQPPRTSRSGYGRPRSEPYRNPPPGSYKIERQSF